MCVDSEVSVTESGNSSSIFKLGFLGGSREVWDGLSG